MWVYCQNTLQRMVGADCYVGWGLVFGCVELTWVGIGVIVPNLAMRRINEERVICRQSQTLVEMG